MIIKLLDKTSTSLRTNASYRSPTWRAMVEIVAMVYHRHGWQCLVRLGKISRCQWSRNGEWFILVLFYLPVILSTSCPSSVYQLGQHVGMHPTRLKIHAYGWWLINHGSSTIEPETSPTVWSSRFGWAVTHLLPATESLLSGSCAES